MNNRVINVLLVEDNSGDADYLRELLAEANSHLFLMERVDRLQRGLERLAKGGINVVLLDLSLPDSHGLDTFTRIHRQETGVPVIVLTGLDDEVLAAQALGKGAQDYLVKDQVNKNLLIRAIRYAIERHRLRAELEQKTRGLQSSQESLQQIIEKSVDGLAIIDREGVVHFVNPSAEALLDQKADHLLGERFSFPVVAGETSELGIVHSNGEKIFVEMYVAEINWRGEDVYLATLRDATARKQIEEQLKSEANYDALTGLFNRRYLMEQLAAAVHSAKRYHSPLSLCLCDLDDFKLINDTHGHSVGDDVLAQFGKLVREQLRVEDIAGRVGGDEFCIVFPHDHAAQAAIGIERIRTHLEKLVFHTKKKTTFSVTGTFGVADFDASTMGDTDLLEAADQALYQAKELGKNRVLVKTLQPARQGKGAGRERKLT